MYAPYAHGYHEIESARLATQADILVDLVHDGVIFAPGTRVLEAGCGVGAQTIHLARRSPDCAITSIDVSRSSLAAAVERMARAGIDNVIFVRADVLDLPDSDGELAAGTFDHVFVCYLLEHLPDPVEALAHLRTMLRPGGTITVVEGDQGTTYYHPESEAAQAAIDTQVRLQRSAGGNPHVGRRLYPLLDAAGFGSIEVTPREVYVDGSRPELMQRFTRDTFVAMIEGSRAPAIAAGLTDATPFDAGIRDLLRTSRDGGVLGCTFFRATATAPAPAIASSAILPS